MSQDVQREQLEDLAQNGTENGKCYDFNELLQAYQTYIDNYEKLREKKDWKQQEKLWCQGVGGAQTRVPAHVANEYCRPDRSFYPTPDFKESHLPRSFKISDEDDRWYPVALTARGGGVGVDRAVARGARAMGSYTTGGYMGRGGDEGAAVERAAVLRLCRVRSGSREELTRAAGAPRRTYGASS
jgi:hypothetical protein